jgi:hypothetical protein
MSDISYPFISDTIPFWVVAAYGTIGPIIFIILIEFGNSKLYPFQNRGNQPIRFLLRKFGLSDQNKPVLIF